MPDASEINFKDIGDETIQAYGPDNLKDRWRRLQRRAKKELSAITGEDVDFQGEPVLSGDAGWPSPIHSCLQTS